MVKRAPYGSPVPYGLSYRTDQPGYLWKLFFVFPLLIARRRDYLIDSDAFVDGLWTLSVCFTLWRKHSGWFGCGVQKGWLLWKAKTVQSGLSVRMGEQHG